MAAAQCPITSINMSKQCLRRIDKNSHGNVSNLGPPGPRSILWRRRFGAPKLWVPYSETSPYYGYACNDASLVHLLRDKEKVRNTGRLIYTHGHLITFAFLNMKKHSGRISHESWGNEVQGSTKRRKNAPSQLKSWCPLDPNVRTATRVANPSSEAFHPEPYQDQSILATSCPGLCSLGYKSFASWHQG